MIALFRKIRKSTMTKGKIFKYLAYAIGEIILVVIGILIAVQINNANETRKQNRQLQGILKNITYDLSTDTTIVSNYIKIEEHRIAESKRILAGEITTENFTECALCPSITTTYTPVTINTKGFEQLKGVIDQNTNVKDSLSADITQFYTIFSDFISSSNEMLKNESLKNIEHFKSYDWFVDWTQGNNTPEAISYFATSEDYRKRVASYNILAANNHLQYLKSYKQNAAYILNKINTRLAKDSASK